MQEDLFFSNVDENQSEAVEHIIDDLKQYAEKHRQRIYVVTAPIEMKEAYDYPGCFAIAIPNRRIALVKVQVNNDFGLFCSDFREDIGILSSKYSYLKKLGRPRTWISKLFTEIDATSIDNFMVRYLSDTVLDDRRERRLSALVTSLIIGSINNIETLEVDAADTIIDSIKQRIVLFDGQQSRFIYENRDKRRIVIQGMAGTGKTELLLHKLRELYTSHPDNGKRYSIFFTCHNKVLANSMEKRITSFFNTMRVDEQIEWNTRLHVARSWGSRANPNSGLYSFICHNYGLPFQAYRDDPNFDDVCKRALEAIPEDAPACLDYILVDESQDFPESFFNLCERVVTEKVYIAGDVFQDIYEIRSSNELNVDYLLTNCYRTDPRTLLFAHALGLGLCEEPVIRWLDANMWTNCGYSIHDSGENRVAICRNPINRFDFDGEESFNELPKAIEMLAVDDFAHSVIDIVGHIKKTHRTVKPGDIAIVFPGNGSANYRIADEIRAELRREFQWNSIVGYEQKNTDENCVFISNRNNIKGLEFPFVICFVIGEMNRSLSLRNALYMILTRSFLSSYLVYSKSYSVPIDRYEILSKQLETSSEIIVRKPGHDEIERQEETVTKILAERRAKSLGEAIDECLDRSEITGKDRHDAKRRLMTFFESESNTTDSDDLDERIMQVISAMRL